jgi:hypothetical protein
VRALRTLTKGVAAWVIIVAAVFGLTALRSLADSAKLSEVPYPTLPRISLTASQARQWTTFPSYTDAVPVLMYHAVGAHSRSKAVAHLNVTRRMFALQMRAFHVAGFHTLTLRQYVRWYEAWRQGKGSTVALPPKPILITFDDGRIDAYRAASLILRHYHFHATDLVVPGWVAPHPGFELQWSTMRKMERGGVFTIQEHFGYGTEGVPINREGTVAGRFGALEYFPAADGRPAHVETFRQFAKAMRANMRWGKQQLEQEVPGYRDLAMAVPESDYGTSVPIVPGLAHIVLGYLDSHYPVVFDGDYLYGGEEGSIASSRLNARVVYRMKMENHLSLAGLRCRLYDFVKDTPIWMEYQCKSLRT